MALKWFLGSAFTQVFGNSKQAMEDGNFLASLKEKGVQNTKEDQVEMKKEKKDNEQLGFFQMPLHYPRYKKEDYEKMEEWRIDMLLREYGVFGFKGSLDEKRAFAIGTFLWLDQL